MANICTAHVLLAVMAGMYAVYHGPEGLTRIARRVHRLTAILAEGLRRLGYRLESEAFFDTVTVLTPDWGASIWEAARVEGLRSEEHTSELQSLMRISYAVFCLKKKKTCEKQYHQRLYTPQ